MKSFAMLLVAGAFSFACIDSGLALDRLIGLGDVNLTPCKKIEARFWRLSREQDKLQERIRLMKARLTQADQAVGQALVNRVLGGEYDRLMKRRDAISAELYVLHQDYLTFGQLRSQAYSGFVPSCSDSDAISLPPLPQAVPPLASEIADAETIPQDVANASGECVLLRAAYERETDSEKKERIFKKLMQCESPILTGRWPKKPADAPIPDDVVDASGQCALLRAAYDRETDSARKVLIFKKLMQCESPSWRSRKKPSGPSIASLPGSGGQPPGLLPGVNIPQLPNNSATPPVQAATTPVQNVPATTPPTQTAPAQPSPVIPAATPPAGSGCPGLEVDTTFKPSPPGQAAFKCVGKRGTSCSVAGGAGLSSGVLPSIDEFCGAVTGCRCSIEGKEINVPIVLACLKSLAKKDKPEKCWSTPGTTTASAGIIPLGAMPAAPNLKLEGACVRDLHTNTLRCPNEQKTTAAPITPYVPPPVVAIAPPIVYDVPVPPNVDAHAPPESSEGHTVPVPPKVKKQARQPRRPVNRGVPAQNHNDAATAAAVIGIIGAIAAGSSSRPSGPSGGHATPAPRRRH